MATEDDLRELFAASPPPRGIDAKRVIAKSRARRLPRQIAVGAVSTLAVAGIVVVSLPALLPQQQSAISTLSESGGAAPEASDSAKRAPADKTNLCGAPVADVAPSFYGLQLEVAFPATAPVGTEPIQGTVRLTNAGNQRVTGTTVASPAITLSQDGIVLWHSNGPASDLAVTVDLAPGQSMEYPASFSPVRCDVQDDETESFRPDLPPVPAGGYNLSAAIDFMPAASMMQLSTPGLDLVTGPLSPITMQ